MSAQGIVRKTLLTYAAVIIAWIFAWILRVRIGDRTGWLDPAAADFAYWTFAKFCVWIVPAYWLIRASGRSVAEAYALRDWRRWSVWGGGIGAIVALLTIIPNLVGGRSALTTATGFALANALVVAPLFEEFLMRAAILGNLRLALPFWKSNVLAALLFAVLHMPGWYFEGVLATKLLSPVGGAAYIFLLGLAIGYAFMRGRSAAAGTIVHFLNNLA